VILCFEATFMEDHVMATAAVGATVDEFRSPLRKLVRFFQHSRDSWKGKCQDAKKQCKLMGNQVRAVEKSRAEWRSRAEQSEQRVRELEQELAELKTEQCFTG
jgi:peptidoglycan hydrolase CwlO-like protein